MAKGTDSEEFVLMSESSESGSALKRELGLVTNNLTSSVSRFSSSNGILEYSRKRFKKSGGTSVENSLRKELSLNDQQKSGFATKLLFGEQSGTGCLEKSNLVEEQNSALIIAPVEEELRSSLVEMSNLVDEPSSALNNAPIEEELRCNAVEKSYLAEEQNNALNNAPIEDELRCNAVNKEKLPIEEESETKKNSLNVSIEEVLGNNHVSPMNVENDLMISPSTEELKRNVAREASKEVRSRRVTRSAVKSNGLPLVLDVENDTKKAKNVDQNSPEMILCLRGSNSTDYSPDAIEKNPNHALTVPIEGKLGNDSISPSNVEVVEHNSLNPNETSPKEIVLCLKSPSANEETSVLHKSSSSKLLNRFVQSTRKRKAKSTLSKSNRKVHNASKLKVPTILSANNDVHIETVKHGTDSDLEHHTELLLVNGNNGSRKALKFGASKNNGISKEVGTNVETPTMVTGESNEVHDASPIRPPRRFTRSVLTVRAKTVMSDGTMGVDNALESEVDKRRINENGGVQNTLPDKSSSAALESKVEPMVIAASVKPLRRFTRSALECTTEPWLMDQIGKVQNTLLETPLRRFSQSAPESKKEHQATDEDSKLQSTVPEKPLRRFTRSALRWPDEPMELLETATSCGSSPSRTSDVINPIRTPSHKNLEMKMSKKIALTKFPTKISELLETGMLEGLSVTYKFQAQQNGVLQGTIKDCGILCSCTLCNGSKVVTPNQFERHAGSGNRKPAYYMYLDNGNSLHDVLNACKDAPLDILEATIQIAIKSPSLKHANCLNCKQPLPVLKSRKTLVLCNSCLDLKKSQTSPCTVDKVARSNRLKTPKKPDDASKITSPQNKSSRGKITRKDLGLHKLVFEENGLPDGTELAYYVRGQKLLEGYKKGFGIFCFCCNSEISPSQFEAHAGWATRRKPYLNIYTSNGVSLHELSISLSKGRKFSAKDNDDLCGICADFGDLLLCDGCPRAFHKDCVGVLSVPRGKWYCPYCQNVHRDQSCAYNANAVAAGRVSGVDPIEQISKRCIRIIKTPETEVGGCTLCRIPGFTKSRFGPRTIILCDQCEKEFHVGCLRDHKMGDLKEIPKGKWFCSRDCSRINTALQKCILRGPEELPGSMTKLIKMKQEETNSNLDISWRLLNGKIASPESRSLLSKAVAIFHNRFDPIVDALSGRDLIPCMVYGRSIRDQDFGGMCCAVLTVNSAVVSAGLLRIFGEELAELPLVATSSDHQGQGYFQSLFSCIERLLGFLNVKNLVLPAAEEAEAIWTEKFGFQKMSHDQLTKYTKDYQMTVFSGTPVLYKPVPKCRVKETN